MRDEGTSVAPEQALESGRANPRRPRRELAYEPALDGLRAVAVLAVLLYHGGVSWAGGGFLGVEIFFVLSGFLITSLLLAEKAQSGTVRLGDFWARRARRLLPALLALVITCSVYESVVGAARAVPDFGADALATLLYVANWHQLWTNAGYFSQAALVSPLQHTWSLAIEEQFYLIWPLVLIGLIFIGGRLSARSREGAPNLLPLLFFSLGGALLSAAEMALLYGNGGGLERVYYGTDTRAQGLLVGAALAVLTAIRKRRVGRAAEDRSLGAGLDGRLAGLLGVCGALGVAALLAVTREQSSFLYRGGFLALDVAVVCVIVGATASRGFSPVRAIASLRPLREIGVISYGLYLWHFPLMAWLTAASTGVSGAALLWLRLAASFAAAVVSFYLIEQPVRRRQLRGRAVQLLTPVALSLALAAALVAWSTGAAVPPASPRLTRGATADCARSCKKISALVVGDSIGLTVGIQLAINEKKYGFSVNTEASLGCSFIRRGEVDELGSYGPPSSDCSGDLARWSRIVASTRPDVVLVEMGYWDEMDWRWGSGDYVHIGEAAFDVLFRKKAADLVRRLSDKGAEVVILTVPWVAPAPWADGSPAPQASAKRHLLVNALLESVVRKFPRSAALFNVSPSITPAGHYEAYVDGGICRNSDGIHLYWGPSNTNPRQSPCGAALQRSLFSYLRRLVGDRPRRS